MFKKEYRNKSAPGDRREMKRDEPREPRPVRPEIAIPKGVPVAHLKSASYNTFLYRKMIETIDGEPSNGDLVAVKDKYDRFFRLGVLQRPFGNPTPHDQPGSGDADRRIPARSHHPGSKTQARNYEAGWMR